MLIELQAGNKLPKRMKGGGFVVYACPENQQRTHGHVVAWNHVQQILDENK